MTKEINFSVKISRIESRWNVKYHTFEGYRESFTRDTLEECLEVVNSRLLKLAKVVCEESSND